MFFFLFDKEHRDIMRKVDVLDQTSDIGIGTCEAGWLGGLVTIVSHVRAPLEIRVLEPVYTRGIVSKKAHACGVYSTFGSSTSKYSLKTPRLKSTRVFRESCMHGM